MKQELKDLAVSMGAIDARVANLEMLKGPPSADPTYVLPEAQSAIAFAVPLGNDFIPDYFGKVTRTVFKQIMYDTYQLIGNIGESMVDLIEKQGFKALSPSPNGYYRQKDGKIDFGIPDFSHRFAAVASGLGTFGWSGNLMVNDHYSSVFLGSVITDAVLPTDEQLKEDLCDNCRICARVCPLEYVQPKSEQKVELGGREYTYNAKGNHMRCGLACSGYVGRSQDGTWSSWAALPYDFPEKDEALLDMFASAISDPATLSIRRHTGINKEGKYAKWAKEGFKTRKGVLCRSLEDTNPTCCNCLLVCSGPIEWRKKLMQTLHSSGVVELTADGQKIAVKTETTKEEIHVETTA